MPVLFGLTPSDFQGPMSDRNCTSFVPGSPDNKSEFLTLIRSINSVNKASSNNISDHTLEDSFEVAWPQVEQELAQIIEESDSATPLRGSQSEGAEAILEEIRKGTMDTKYLLDNMLGDRRWTFRGNARIDPLSAGDYRNLALGLAMLKTLAEIEEGEYAWPTGGALRTMLMLRDPLEVLLARAHAPLIRGVSFREPRDRPDAPWPITYMEDDREYDEEGNPYDDQEL